MKDAGALAVTSSVCINWNTLQQEILLVDGPAGIVVATAARTVVVTTDRSRASTAVA
jgi:uncharacterized protein (DUF2345 family)